MDGGQSSPTLSSPRSKSGGLKSTGRCSRATPGSCPLQRVRPIPDLQLTHSLGIVHAHLFLLRHTSRCSRLLERVGEPEQRVVEPGRQKVLQARQGDRILGAVSFDGYMTQPEIDQFISALVQHLIGNGQSALRFYRRRTRPSLTGPRRLRSPRAVCRRSCDGEAASRVCQGADHAAVRRDGRAQEGRCRGVQEDEAQSAADRRHPSLERQDRVRRS